MSRAPLIANMDTDSILVTRLFWQSVLSSARHQSVLWGWEDRCPDTALDNVRDLLYTTQQ